MFVVALAVGATSAACDGDEATTATPSVTGTPPGASSSTAPTTEPATSPAPGTGGTTAGSTPSTTATTGPATTGTRPATTTIECQRPTNLDDRSDGFPGRLSTLVGTDIRTGAHPCFERVVIELGGTGPFPGWSVRYEQPPILDDPRGEPVTIDGTAFLAITVEVWMPTIEGDGYQGPTRLAPTNVEHIAEVVQVGNFESVTSWVVGLDAARPFEVSTLRDPPRLVVDIADG